MLSGYWNQFFNEGVVISEQIAELEKYAKLAEDLACPIIRIFGGGNLKDSKFAAKHAMEFADILNSLGKLLDSYAVKLAVETHDCWYDPKVMKSLFNLVPDQRIGINWDIIHPLRFGGFSEEQTFEYIGDRILHGHMHQATSNTNKIEWLPLDSPDGVHDHQTFFRLLRSIPYEGYISGEWIDWNTCNHLKTELKAASEICGSTRIT